MRQAHENTPALWVDLTDDKIQVLNSSRALGPYDPEYMAIRLGFPSGHALEAEADRVTDALRAHQPMPFDDWCIAIDIINGLMSPRDSEWQTVTGIDYFETAASLVTITRKVDIAFDGTFRNPTIGPEPLRSSD